MNKTFSFVALDFRLIKPYRISILLLLILGIVMGGWAKSVSTLSSYFMVSLMLIVSYPFSISDKNGLDTLYSTLALKRKTVVIGRYLFVLILEVIFIILAFICSLALSIVTKTEFILSEMLFILSMLSCIFSLVIAIQYPIYFKYGYNKAKILSLVPLFIVFLAIIQLPTLAKLFNFNFSWDTIITIIMKNTFLIYIVPVVLGLILLAFSCSMSCKIYTKRDLV